MRPVVLAVLAAGLAFVPAAHAAPNPVGAVCAYVPLDDPQTEGTRTGLVAAALVLADDTPGVVYPGSVTCTVQSGWLHGQDEYDYVTGPVTTGVAAAAGIVTMADPGRMLIVCTRVDILNGPTLYWDAVAQAWSTSPDVLCAIPL